MPTAKELAELAEKASHAKSEAENSRFQKEVDTHFRQAAQSWPVETVLFNCMNIAGQGGREFTFEIFCDRSVNDYPRWWPSRNVVDEKELARLKKLCEDLLQRYVAHLAGTLASDGFSVEGSIDTPVVRHDAEKDTDMQYGNDAWTEYPVKGIVVVRW